MRAGFRSVPNWWFMADGETRRSDAGHGRTLALSDPPTAVLCYNDNSALGRCGRFAAGEAIPEDNFRGGFRRSVSRSYTSLADHRPPAHAAQWGLLAMETCSGLMSGRDSGSGSR